MSLDATETSEFLDWMHSEHPDWLALSQSFQTVIDDDSLALELPEFSEYATFVGNKIIMNFIFERGTLPSLQKGHYDIRRNTTEYWPETWTHSGLRDEVILEMVGRVFKKLGLYQPLPLMYFMLQHFVRRLDMDISLDLAVQRNRLRKLMEESYPQEVIDVINQLSDSCTEMRNRTYNIDGETYYDTNFDKLLLPAITNHLEFQRRVIFLATDRRGQMLRRFEFIHWFDRAKAKKHQRESLDVSSTTIADVFADAMANEKYQLFKQNKSQFAENLYQDFLRETLEL